MSNLEFNVQYTVFTCNSASFGPQASCLIPLSYTRSTSIPCAITIETADLQALDIISAPTLLTESLNQPCVPSLDPSTTLPALVRRSMSRFSGAYPPQAGVRLIPWGEAITEQAIYSMQYDLPFFVDALPFYSASLRGGVGGLYALNHQAKYTRLICACFEPGSRGVSTIRNADPNLSCLPELFSGALSFRNGAHRHFAPGKTSRSDSSRHPECGARAFRATALFRCCLNGGPANPVAKTASIVHLRNRDSSCSCGVLVKCAARPGVHPISFSTSTMTGFQENLYSGGASDPRVGGFVCAQPFVGNHCEMIPSCNSSQSAVRPR
ncbi:hypothetical protein C8R47DRAFT_1068168 [Mycena vitilis]|nr:hypothetical protein C8R47DRAFT_1068168 [Mycena vitilis]